MLSKYAKIVFPSDASGIAFRKDVSNLTISATSPSGAAVPKGQSGRAHFWRLVVTGTATALAFYSVSLTQGEPAPVRAESSRISICSQIASTQPGDNAQIVAVKAGAQKAVEAGDLNKVDALLTKIGIQQRQDLDRFAVNAAKTMARRGAIALTRLQYAQMDPGNAPWTVDEGESGTKRLEEAVAAYRAALEVNARDRAPLQWAMTQMNLGNALTKIGERESGTRHLEEVVAAYQAALEENTRDRVPLEWARTEMNLGTALETLGERESGTRHLEEAVAAYRAALEERTRERVPLQWAATQNNLGNALKTLGERESGTKHLEEAVAAHRAALEERTRDRVPLQWAATQMNLGNALTALGERESGTKDLEEAVAAYRAALEENTRDRVPLDWAMALGNQGVAMMRLAEREKNSEMAETALFQINTAYETLRSGGQAPFADYYKARRPEARAVLDRLTLH